MSTIVKVKVKREGGKGHTHFVYPPEYDAQKIQVLCYENKDEHQARNDGTQLLIGVINDKDKGQFLASKDIEEIIDEDAKVMGRRWRPQIEKMTDERTIMKVLSKYVLGRPLTQEDKDVLDSDKPNRGINKTKIFDEMLKDVKSKRK